jgi:hypothetical protein
MRVSGQTAAGLLLGFPKQFQEKCEAVFCLELRKNKELERFRVPMKNALVTPEMTFSGVPSIRSTASSGFSPFSND